MSDRVVVNRQRLPGGRQLSKLMDACSASNIFVHTRINWSRLSSCFNFTTPRDDKSSDLEIHIEKITIKLHTNTVKTIGMRFLALMWNFNDRHNNLRESLDEGLSRLLGTGI